MKKCPRCGAIKEYGEFGRNRQTRDGMSVYCRACKQAIGADIYRRKRESAGFTVRPREAFPPGYKRCAKCHVVKPHEEFHRLRAQSGGFNPYCKECRKPMAAKVHLQRTYGLTPEELTALVAAQGGLCAICQTKAAVHVDHDHVTGKIRGVLCFTCNVALGQLKDDVALFRKAIDYLEGELG